MFRPAEPPNINPCFPPPPRDPRALPPSPRSARLVSEPACPFFSMPKPDVDSIWFLAALTSVGLISDIDLRRSNRFFVRRADDIFDKSSESSTDLECRNPRDFDLVAAEGILNDCVPSYEPFPPLLAPPPLLLLPFVVRPANAASAAAPSPGAHECASGEMFAARWPKSVRCEVSVTIASFNPCSS